MEGITYTQAANHLTAAVSELPEYRLTRKVSASSSETPRIRGGGVTTIIVILRRRGGCKHQTKAFLCQMDWFSQGITQTGKNYQKKTNSLCWIHEARKKKGGTGTKRQISDITSIAEQLQVIKRTISELVSSKSDHINSVSSKDKVKNKVQHAKNDPGNAFGGQREKSNQERRQLPSVLMILSYMFSLAAYWFPPPPPPPPRHRIISRIVSSVRKIAKNKTTKTEYQHRLQPTSYGRVELQHMPILKYWDRIVLSCHIQERNVRFLPTHHSTKQSGTFLLSGGYSLD